ncbi:MAG: YigZ family protein [Bacilli bacterium]|nr:YigZ family protein [Bacilli bacterium]
MVTIKEMSKGEIIVENSTFISFLYPINSIDDVNNIINAIRKENPKARHVCYAYELNGAMKSSDDGEPKGTAGRPLLELLMKKELFSSLLVVVRYFGGTLLGAGRLLRTYVESGNIAINNAILYESIEMNVYRVNIDTNKYDILQSFVRLNNITMRNVEFDESISLELLSESDIIKAVIEYFQGKIDIQFVNKEIAYKKL